MTNLVIVITWTSGGGTLTKTEDNPSNVFATHFRSPLNFRSLHSNVTFATNGNTSTISGKALLEIPR